MKIYDMAKEFDLKHTEFIPIINKLGFEYKGFSAEIKEDDEESMRKQVKDYLKQDKMDNLKEKFDKVRMVGVYYNPDTQKYSIYGFETELSNLENLGIEASGEFSTIYNAKPHFAKLIYDVGVLKPNPIERELAKKR